MKELQARAVVAHAIVVSTRGGGGPTSVAVSLTKATGGSYEAIAAATVQATIAPSLYLLGLGSFAVSLLGPRRLQVPTFLAGAALCLAAIGVETRP